MDEYIVATPFRHREDLTFFIVMHVTEPLPLTLCRLREAKKLPRAQLYLFIVSIREYQRFCKTFCTVVNNRTKCDMFVLKEKRLSNEQ